MTVQRALRSSVLDDLAGAIGVDGAIAVARAYGGIRLYVPRQVTSRPVADLGAPVAALLVQYFGGTDISVPISERRRWTVRAIAARDPRPPIPAIALEAGVTERYVQMILRSPVDAAASSEEDSAQLKLF